MPTPRSIYFFKRSIAELTALHGRRSFGLEAQRKAVADNLNAEFVPGAGLFLDAAMDVDAERDLPIGRAGASRRHREARQQRKEDTQSDALRSARGAQLRARDGHRRPVDSKWRREGDSNPR